MIYLDQERLDQFFKSVAGGFATTPREVLLFFIVIALFVSFLIVFYFIQRRRIHSRFYRQSAKKYAELIARHGLSGVEVQLIEAMGECLPKERQKVELLTDQHLFNLCAGKLQSRMKICESTLASLKLKLGFRVEQPEGSPSSGVELPVGKPAQFQRRNYYRRSVYLSVLVSPLYGSVETYRSFLLELGGGGASLGNPEKLFGTGDVLELAFSTKSSDFRFPARVVRTSQNASVMHVQFESIAESSRDRIIGSLNRITDL
jgi:hypothetical protein